MQNTHLNARRHTSSRSLAVTGGPRRSAAARGLRERPRASACRSAAISARRRAFSRSANLSCTERRSTLFETAFQSTKVY